MVYHCFKTSNPLFFLAKRFVWSKITKKQVTKGLFNPFCEQINFSKLYFRWFLLSTQKVSFHLLAKICQKKYKNSTTQIGPKTKLSFIQFNIIFQFLETFRIFNNILNKNWTKLISMIEGRRTFLVNNPCSSLSENPIRGLPLTRAHSGFSALEKINLLYFHCVCRYF